jgi:hypothetical protein
VIQRRATDWMMGGSSPGRDWTFYSLPPCSDRFWDPPGVKWPESEADHSPPSSAEIKMCGAIHPLPPYAFMS